ncbi:hypothetical protein A5724_20735, partial [Mycobacterium sp. ACS1612]
MGGDVVDEAVAALRAAHTALAGLPVEVLTRPQLLAVLDEVETLSCQLPAHRHGLLARLQTQATPTQLGAKSWRQVLAIRWRLSSKEAGRRLAEAAVLAPRRAVSGEPLEPVLAYTAAAQTHGAITAEHVRVLRTAMESIPAGVDAATRHQVEADLVRAALGAGPKELKDTADRLIFLLDQDGPEPDDTQRAARREIRMGPQHPDGNSKITGTLSPEGRAIWEAIWAKLAAPGMGNPDDAQPCVSGTPSQAQIEGDHRSLAQRQHDALVAIGRSVLESGALGQHNGVATSIIIRTTVQDLEHRAGVGVTAGGTVLPLATLIRMAARAHPWLAVFDRASGSALDLFRSRRSASVAQRIMLIARDGGCTKPGCTVPAYGCQVHHAAADWADDGQTNVDDLGLACGPDNRMVEPGGWSTRLNDRHEVEWIPHHSWTPAKPASTPTTPPNDSSAHQTTTTPADPNPTPP